MPDAQEAPRPPQDGPEEEKSPEEASAAEIICLWHLLGGRISRFSESIVDEGKLQMRKKHRGRRKMGQKKRKARKKRRLKK